MSLKKCFIRVINLSTIETQRQSNFRKKRRCSFDFDNSKKIIKLFKSRHWNEKLNSINRKQKKKIKNDRNRITATEIEFKKKRSSEVREPENHETEFKRLKLLEKSFRNNDFKKFNHKRQSDVRLNSHDFIAFFTKQHVKLIMSEKKMIWDKVDEKRVKICAAYERVETIIVVESITHF